MISVSTVCATKSTMLVRGKVRFLIIMSERQVLLVD